MVQKHRCVAGTADPIRSARLSKMITDDRLERHRSFTADRRESGDQPKYEAEHYDFRVITEQERSIRLYEAMTVDRTKNPPRRYAVEYEPQ